jgi:hypothetical protein
MPNAPEIERRFTYSAPDAEKKAIHEHVDVETKILAHKLDHCLPEGREKSLALTALQEARMWANAAIATTA